VAAADVGNAGPALQLIHDALERRQPRGDEIVVVARAEEAGHGTEHTAGLVTPGHTTTRLEGGLNLGLIVEHCRHQIEAPHQVDGTVLTRKHHGLFGRKGKFSGAGIVGQIIRGRLIAQPLAHVALIDLCRVGQFDGCHRAVGVERLV
jgi:hypothetical protein